MQNIISYVAEYGHLTFDKRPFGEVDSLILAQLSYIRFDAVYKKVRRPKRGFRLSEYRDHERFDELFRSIRVSDTNTRLFLALAHSKRFGDVRVFAPVADTNVVEEKQFFAVSFHLDKKLHYVAFRGTDSTLNGWKDNANLSYSETSTQREAVRYLEAFGKYLKGDILLGGHSKGGNLAVYSAIFAPAKVKGRIRHVYNHDGPGFNETIYDHPTYVELAPMVSKTVPEYSIFGCILWNREQLRTIQSSASGMNQHDPFTWIVVDGDFVSSDTPSRGSTILTESLNRWISEIPYTKREYLVDTLFDVITSGNPESVDDVVSNWKKFTLDVIKSDSFNPDTREDIFNAIKRFIKIYSTVALKTHGKNLITKLPFVSK